MSKFEMQEKLSQADISGSEREGQEPGLELVKGEGLDVVVDVANDLAGKIEGDKKVTGEDVLKLDKALGKVKLNISGEKMTIDEVKKIPDLKMNMELWEKIMKGDKYILDDINAQIIENLTYLTVGIASRLIELAKRDRKLQLVFTKLEKLSDNVADVLGHASFEGLKLNGVRFLSDKQVDSLCNFQGGLFLEGLEDVSDEAIERLASIQQWNLHVSGDIRKRIREFRINEEKK